MAQPLQRRHSTSKMGTRGQPAASRAAILRAAAEEFAEHGIAGARTEAIARVGELLRKGIAEGEFRKIDPAHFIPSVVAMTIFYFSSAPLMQKIVRFNPLAPERIAERRAAVLDFMSAALFRPDCNTVQRGRP